MLLRALEFIALFVALPALFAFARHRVPAIPALWVLAGFCLLLLLRDPSFDRPCLWNSAAVPVALPGILALFSVVAVLFAFGVRFFAPEVFLNYPRSSPATWAAVMLLYPITSVYPQGIIYRAFVFHRYGSSVPNPWLLVLVSAAAFAFVHIIFRNWLAVGLTFVSGLLFAARYAQTGSLLASALEHALYGCLMFTVGLGHNFYHGAAQR